MDGNNSLLDQLDSFEQNDDSKNEKDYVQKDKNRRFGEYNKLIGILALVLIFVLKFVWDYFSYINIIGKTETLTPDEQDFVVDFKSKQNDYVSKFKSIFPTLGEDAATASALPASVENQSGSILLDTVNSYLANDSISYAQKRDDMETFSKLLAAGLNTNETSIKKVQSDIGVYGFLPQEVDTIVSDNSLQRSIMSVEAIKLYAALSIFSKMDSFLSNVSSYWSASQDATSNQISYYLGRGEKDIEEYLTDCTLNPYQNGSCDKSSIDNFETFYKVNNLNSKFLSSKFKNLMTYLFQTLDNDAFPRLSITISDLDPVQDKISFNIDINTFPDDEKALADKNILNPHIFIAGMLMDLLRKSTYISGKDLKFDSIKVTKRDYDVGGQKISVNNSTFSFDVYISKSVDREIYDYVYSK